MTPRQSVRLALTDEQKAQIKATTGKQAKAVELDIEELEARIAPSYIPPGPNI